jgi:hypothetical protein
VARLLAFVIAVTVNLSALLIHCIAPNRRTTTPPVDMYPR